MKKYFLLTPGPTPIPPQVAQKESLPILHHRTDEFGQVFVEVINGLKYVFQTKNETLLMTSSGTGAMESTVANLLSPGDEVIVASSGVFGDRWAKICDAYGIKVIKLDSEWGRSVEPQNIEETLRSNPKIKAVFTTHTETSTGVVNDLKTIGEIVDKTEAVLVIDAISGLGAQTLYTDDWKLDVVVSGSQKGFMCAPGLAFVCISPKAWKYVETAKCPRFYWDYRRMKKSVSEKQTPFTPAVTLVVSLAESLRMIKEEGLEKIFARTHKLATVTRAALKSLNLKLFADEKCACDVLTSAMVPDGIEGGKIVKTLRQEFGISIAGGQEKLKGKIIRLAHMGYIDQFDLIVGFAGLEIVLGRLGHKVEPGRAVGVAEKILGEHDKNV
ncbi:MAG: alanine--glyoxylate aminotransferase family protein [Elusimicrobia bacterium]|nr:alanine--glyoxylate aminotransferase family protein [Elusimicrobiota bacterium]